MTSFFKTIDFGVGELTHIEDGLHINEPLMDQIELLREDLLQVHYDNGNLIVDVGWYPSFDPTGSFSVFVIQDFNWEQPIYQRQSNSMEDLAENIRQAITYLPES